MRFVRTIVYKVPVSAALQEAILEALRLGAVAAASTIITFFISYVKTLPNPEAWIIILSVILRTLDKYKYIDNQEKKVKGENNLGLVGF